MRVVIVGGGQAAASVASRLIQLGFKGEILVLSRECTPPYERPPLSKGHLASEGLSSPAYVPSEGFWHAENAITFLSAEVLSIDPKSGSVETRDKRIAYDQLVLATGASPRYLPAKLTRGLKGLCYLRTLQDANDLRRKLAICRSLALVGAGYIGLEVAATARALGLNVTLIEREPRILQRVASNSLAKQVRSRHADHGITILENAEVEKILGQSKVTGLLLADGSVVAADLVVVGIGTTPNTTLACAAGMHIENGIAVNEFGQTSHPRIWAAGDCTSFRHKERPIRLESVQNAIDQGETVAENILGAGIRYTPLPTFWSEQGELLIQMAGLWVPGLNTIERPSKSGMSFWHFNGSRLTAVEVVDDPKTFAIARRLLAKGISPDPKRLEVPATNLKALLRAV